MAQTNAERQASLKARREEMGRLLAEQNTALMSENIALRAEVDALKDKMHRLELAALRSQLKAQKPVQVVAAGKPAAKKKVSR